MKLDQEIFRVLMAAGSNGLKMEKIARHVYNSCNSIFSPLDYKEVYSYVSQFLIKSAKDPRSIIEKGKGYGVYHINYKSTAVRQLMLDFSSAATEDSEGKQGSDSTQENTNDLFSDFF